jgi:NTP pyrophosphatase (non-canonical NTP hydrolase)
MRLQAMYSEQYDLQRYLLENKPDASAMDPNTPFDEKFKHNVLMVIKECTEALDEIPYKKHQYQQKEINTDALKEELVDILKFWMNLCIMIDFDQDEIYSIFMKKSMKVRDRFKVEMKNHVRDRHKIYANEGNTK